MTRPEQDRSTKPTLRDVGATGRRRRIVEMKTAASAAIEASRPDEAPPAPRETPEPR